MATIFYVNQTTPVGGLIYNPTLEEVVDRSPSYGTMSSNLFELINNESGPFNGFKVQFTSNVNGTGNFSYAFGPFQPSGTITGLTVRTPDGTIVLQGDGGAYGFLNANILNIYNLLINPNATPAAAISSALGSLLGKANEFAGSGAADHITAYGADGTSLYGNGGNDLLYSPGNKERKLVGGDGNDLIRVEKGTYQVHGANDDGTGGAGQTDTLEIVGYAGNPSHAFFTKFTNIDVLRFVVGDSTPGSVDGLSIGAALNLTEIGNLPSALTVHGSSTASPQPKNFISLFAAEDESATTGMTIDLSGWTFKTWNEQKNEVFIATNRAQKPVNDVVTGSMVADDIRTYDGDDTIRGGGGADELFGGNGNDTFVYGLNEAAPGEYVEAGNGADTVLVLSDNNFAGVRFDSVERLKFGGKATATFDADVVGTPKATIIGDDKANTVAVQLKDAAQSKPAIDLSGLTFRSWTDGVDKVIVRGTESSDDITGSTRGDVIAGGKGRDLLEGGAGADAFHFDAGFGKAIADHIVDFSRKQGDVIWLGQSTFKKIQSPLLKDNGVLKKSAFEYGRKADDKKDRIIYDKSDGVLRYDDDGTGKHKAKIIAVFDDAASLRAADILVI